MQYQEFDLILLLVIVIVDSCCCSAVPPPSLEPPYLSIGCLPKPNMGTAIAPLNFRHWWFLSLAPSLRNTALEAKPLPSITPCQNLHAGGRALGRALRRAGPKQAAVSGGRTSAATTQTTAATSVACSAATAIGRPGETGIANPAETRTETEKEIEMGFALGIAVGVMQTARRDGIAPRAAIKDEIGTVPLRAAATVDPDAATKTTIPPNNNNPNLERRDHHQEKNQHRQRHLRPQGVRK